MSLANRLEAALGSRPQRVTPLAGGDIGSVHLVEFARGAPFVVKTPRQGGPDTATAEAAMLRHIAEYAPNVPVPAVIYSEPALLVLEHIQNDGGFAHGAGEDAGHVVAALHSIIGAQNGFEADIQIGAMPQPNGAHDTWIDFFPRDRRLLHGARECVRSRRIGVDLMLRIENLAVRLGDFLHEPDAPRLLHGDLWHGNVLVQTTRVAALIDPACYYGDPQMDLAMLSLFGDPGDRFFEAYREHHTLEEDFFTRGRDVLNLWPLLVHARLFGGGYVGQIGAVLNRLGV